MCAKSICAKFRMFHHHPPPPPSSHHNRTKTTTMIIIGNAINWHTFCLTRSRVQLLVDRLAKKINYFLCLEGITRPIYGKSTCVCMPFIIYRVAQQVVHSWCSHQSTFYQLRIESCRQNNTEERCSCNYSFIFYARKPLLHYTRLQHNTWVSLPYLSN